MNNKFASRSFAETLTAICRVRAPRLLRENGSLNQTAAARYFELDQPTVRRWLNGATPNHDYILYLSEKLRLTPAQIRGELPIREVDGADHSIAEDHAQYSVNTSKKIPLISSTEAGSWNDAQNKYSSEDQNEWTATTRLVSDKSFALRAIGDLMQSSGGQSIPENAIVIFDPETKPVNGSIVAARLSASSDAMIKKLIIDGPNRYLKPLNSAYQTIWIDEKCSIIGVAKQIIQDL